MSSKFQVQELIEQSATRTIHRVRGGDGAFLRLTRILLEGSDRERLKRSPMLQEALTELKALRHPYLCEVLDCGLDEEGIPWVMTRWENGKGLDEVKTEEAEIQAVSKQAKRLLEDFGPVAGAVSFEPAEVIFRGDGREKCLFSIDYYRWFFDISAGTGPGAGRDGNEEVSQLLRRLAVQQLQLPKQKEKEVPIPFVDERSPALQTFEPVPEPWFIRFWTWVFLAVCVAVIVWFTVEGNRRIQEYPRDPNRAIEKRERLR